MIASEMASGPAGLQAIAGLAAIVLGIIALAGNVNDLLLNLVALLALGATLIFTGSTLSAMVMALHAPIDVATLAASGHIPVGPGAAPLGG